MEHRLLTILRYLLGGLSLVVILATAYLIGFSNGRGDREAVYRQAWADAAARLEASGLLPPEPLQLLSIKGVIAKIDGGSITITAEPVGVNPLIDSNPTVRTVELSPEIKVVERTQKTAEEWAKDQDDFISALNETGNAGSLTPPLPYTENDLDRSLLAVGDNVIVEAATDIKFATEIQASRLVRLAPGQ